jgi:hypothetical protein
MSMRRVAGLVLVLALIPCVASGQFAAATPTPPGENFHVELGAMLWWPEPAILIGSDGLLAVGAGGVDFVQEFGLETTRFTEFRAVLRAGKNKFRFAKVPMRYTAQTQLQRTILFGGRSFEVNADATADLSWDLWKIGYEYDFVKKGRGLLGFIVQVAHNKITTDVRATSSLGNVSSLNDVDVPIPTLGLIARVYPHKVLGITAEFSGFKAPGFIRDRFIDANEFEASYTEFDIYATASLSRFFGLQGGYRTIQADYTVDFDSGDLEMKGPYIGALVRF